MGEFVRLEVADGIGTLRLDRPKMNALNVQVQEEIRELAGEASLRDDVKAVVVWGGERVFAADTTFGAAAEKIWAKAGERADGTQELIRARFAARGITF